MSGIVGSGFGTQIAQTAHFLIALGEDTPDTRAAAAAIAQTCEADLATLSAWFSVNWDDFPYGIWVSVDVDAADPRPHADNFWFGTSQSPHIEVYGVGIGNAAGREDIRDEMARMLFVAELAEVLMNFSGNGWDPSASNGEGLSRVAAAELHPLGYYRPAGSANNAPYGSDWLRLPFRTRDAQDGSAPGLRYDFVSVTENTDQNDLSFGCAILFIYYLHTQLRFTWQAIATSPGGTLADTFAHLTGRPATSGFHRIQRCPESAFATWYKCRAKHRKPISVERRSAGASLHEIVGRASGRSSRDLLRRTVRRP